MSKIKQEINSKLDVLAFGAHPDDVELSMSGTILKFAKLGHRVGIVDMTRGEMGSRGNADIRSIEARNSAKILRLKVRENLCFEDGQIQDSVKVRLSVIKQIRLYRPSLVFTHYWDDPHPDHICTSRIVSAACYLSGLKKVVTDQPRFRPKKLIYFKLPYGVHPSFLVDISRFFEKKMKAINCFSSQLHNPKSKQPKTYLSVPEFLPSLRALNQYYGSLINSTYAEAFFSKEAIAVEDPLEFFVKDEKVSNR
jgi:bacillithiol biosynthesis deacetylase BshB1